MKNLFALIIIMVFITLPHASFAQSLTQEINQLCQNKTAVENTYTCQEKQRTALRHVQGYMNMVEPKGEEEGDEYSIAHDPDYLSSLMTCLAQGVTDHGHTDYVVIDDCMKSFSLARAY